jgi:repressor LexA
MLPSPSDMDETTPRQQRILEFIRSTVRDRGYPPTVREIGEAVGLTSSSSVHAQLENLRRKGLLRKDPSKPRAIEVGGARPTAAATTMVPLVGQVAAGAPSLAEQDVEEYLAVPGRGGGGPGPGGRPGGARRPPPGRARGGRPRAAPRRARPPRPA